MADTVKGRFFQGGQSVAILRVEAGLEPNQLADIVFERLGKTYGGNENLIYKAKRNLADQISKWERHQQRPDKQRREIIYDVLKEKLFPECSDFLNEAEKIDDTRKSAPRELKNWSQLAFSAIKEGNFQFHTEMGLIEKCLINLRDRHDALSNDQQVWLSQRYFGLCIDHFSTLRQQMIQGKSLSRSQLESYHFINAPQLRPFGEVQQLHYKDSLLARLYVVPDGQVNLLALSKPAQEQLFLFLKDKVRNGNPSEQTGAAFLLGRVPFIIPSQKELEQTCNEFKQVIESGDEGQHFWSSNTATIALAHTERQDATAFFADIEPQRINYGVMLRTAFYGVRPQENRWLFDDSIELFWLLLQPGTMLMNEHVAMCCIGEIYCATEKIVTQSRNVAFDKVEKVIEFIWEHENWQAAKALSLYLIEAFLPYFNEADKIRARGLLQTKKAQVHPNFRGFSIFD